METFVSISHDSGCEPNVQASAPAYLTRLEKPELLCHSD
jgi:hypothetical protein